MALNFPNQKHRINISVSCVSSMMILFYINMDHLLQLILMKSSVFIPHIKYLKAKCFKVSDLVKVISHTSWGADRTTLLKLNRSLV